MTLGVKSIPVPFQPGVMGEGNRIRAVLDKSLGGRRAGENKVCAGLVDDCGLGCAGN